MPPQPSRAGSTSTSGGFTLSTAYSHDKLVVRLAPQVDTRLSRKTIPNCTLPRGPASTQDAATAYVAAVAKVCQVILNLFQDAPSILPPTDRDSTLENAESALAEIGSERISAMLDAWYLPIWREACGPWFRDTLEEHAAKLREAEENDALSALGNQESGGEESETEELEKVLQGTSSAFICSFSTYPF